MVKSGKARLHTREVATSLNIAGKLFQRHPFIENLSLKIRKGERDQVLLTQFVDDLSL